MTTTTIENQTTVTTQTVVTQTDKPDDGLAMGAAFLARIAAGAAKPAELLSLVQRCQGSQLAGLLSAIEQRLAHYSSRAYADQMAEAVMRSLPQALRLQGRPNDELVIRKKPSPPVKRIEFTKDATGALTGAVVRTGS